MKRKKRRVVETPVEVEPVATKEKVNFFKSKIFYAIVALLGVAIIALGIILPIVLDDEYTEETGVKPYAVITLSNGMTLEYEIYEEQYNNASTNFIYLADIGYFDGTVIFDAQNGWVRFGGWKSNGTHRGDSDKDFLNTIEVSSNYKDNKFGYRMHADSYSGADALPAYNGTGTNGILYFNYERSATEFCIATENDKSLTIENDTASDWKVTPFARPANSQTIKNINKIASLSLDNGTKFNHAYYRAPLDKDGLIKIESVKVTKKLKSKWKEFDFEDWFTDSEVTNRRYSWSKSQKVTGTVR